MSQDSTPAADLSIALPSTGKRTVEVDGHLFNMDFDDAALLHDVLEVNTKIQAVLASSEKSTEKRLAALEAMSGEVARVTDAAFGEGAHATIFGRSRMPILRAVALVNAIAAAIGPVYDAMFAEYLAPSPEITQAVDGTVTEVG